MRNIKKFGELNEVQKIPQGGDFQVFFDYFQLDKKAFADTYYDKAYKEDKLHKDEKENIDNAVALAKVSKVEKVFNMKDLQRLDMGMNITSYVRKAKYPNVFLFHNNIGEAELIIVSSENAKLGSLLYVEGM